MFVLALFLACVAARASAGQQSDPSIDRIRAVLSTTADASLLITAEPPAKSWGGMTLVQPDAARGQFVQVKVPVGEYATRAARAVGSARQRRAQQKARAEVDRALQQFLKQQQ